MGLAGPEDVVTVPMLLDLYQDKTIRFSLLYPNSVAEDDPAPGTRTS